MSEVPATVWFEEWFDSPYYHQLYNHRDDNEARYFIGNLVSRFKPQQGAAILDVACGRGRHALFLGQLGFKVTGIDLAASSIDYALKRKSENVDFYVHDMRKIYCTNCFDWVVNLFTSFGYFEHRYDNINALKAMAFALKPGGMLILDYLNAGIIGNGNNTSDTIISGDVKFTVTRSIDDDWVIKHIRINDGNREMNFHEKVRLLSLNDFEEMFAQVGLSIQHVFGDYDLSPFNPKVSKRLIINAVKQNVVG
ncbi:MAG: class I SAM-dependent methyltransferase [Bacteroidia bacterium]